MLPPGHIAAGFLTAEALLHITKPVLSADQSRHLLWWGMFFGFAPDLDTFVSFAKEQALIVNKQENNHRKFVSHAPILWLLAGLLVYFFAPGTYVKYIGLLLWLGSWSHFLLDSIDYGIMWLWPLSNKVYALRNREIVFDIPEKDFFGYWSHFVKYYTKLWTFYTEILIIVIAFITFFFHH